MRHSRQGVLTFLVEPTMCDSGSNDYELCEAGDAVQQIDCAWQRLLHQSPELLSYAYSNNQTTFGQGPSNRTEFASQNGMTSYDWNYGSLDFPDPSVIGSNIWPGTGPTDCVDDNQAPLQGMGNEIHLESFSQVPAASSPRTMLNMVSSSSWQRSRSVPMLFRSETCHVHRRLLCLPVSGMDR